MNTVKKNVVLSLITAVILAACSDGSPSSDFQSAQVHAVVSPFGPRRLDMTVAQIAKPFVEKGGAKWSRLSETEWMVTAESEDKVTKQKAKIQLVFEKRPQLKGDVLISRVVLNGEDASERDIITMMMMIKHQ